MAKVTSFAILMLFAAAKPYECGTEILGARRNGLEGVPAPGCCRVVFLVAIVTIIAAMPALFSPER